MESKKNKTGLKRVFRLIILVLCGGILGINIYLANSTKILGDQLPMPFGYGVAVVLSGSMEPELSKGDMIIVKNTGDYSVGDVVVYQDVRSLVVHRIVETDGKAVTTKGDANNTSDRSIDISSVKGEVLFAIPFVGNVVNLLKTPLATLVIIVVAVLLLRFSDKRERSADEEERQRIIDEINRLKAEK